MLAQVPGEKRKMARIFVGQPRAAVANLFTEEALGVLQSAGEVVFNEQEKGLDEVTKSEAMAEAEVVITGWSDSKITPDNYDAAPNLKLVTLYGQSLMNIAPEYGMDRGILYSNASPELAISVAELCVGLLFSALRFIPQLDTVMKQQGYGGSHTVPEGFDLFGKTLGFVGFGFIGARVAELLRPFGAKYIVFDPYVSDEKLARFKAERVSLNELFERSDVVSVHSGLTEETRGLISAEQIARMKDNATLVNTARAHVIEEAPLLEAARNGRIRVALDVYWQEPLPDDSPWRKLPNVVLTPHRAGGADRDMVKRMGLFLARDIERFLVRGETPIGLVTREMLARMT
jgi:phosphoglycerate dehydrogenase-like enzyme